MFCGHVSQGFLVGGVCGR
ncbi:hypothetical protein E2C01_069056 [Portunus trituberculatus]|uniref:Uncharacterized protein n=1 Tax=Portunus trituberculatus TaxID=210409 RepID=A0A5B7I1T1_PORTR|nr:hypothetical protein [Portunus trituberculatus]